MQMSAKSPPLEKTPFLPRSVNHADESQPKVYSQTPPSLLDMLHFAASKACVIAWFGGPDRSMLISWNGYRHLAELDVAQSIKRSFLRGIWTKNSSPAERPVQANERAD